MSRFNDEIQLLQLRILELEKQKKEEEECFNIKESIEYNFKIISDVLNNKKIAIKNNKYTKSSTISKILDQEHVKHLEAIYNILHILDNRISDLENNKISDVENNKISDVENK